VEEKLKEHVCKSGRKYFIKKLSWVAKKRIQAKMYKLDMSGEEGFSFDPKSIKVDFDMSGFYIGMVKYAVLNANKKLIDVENDINLDGDGDELFRVASDFNKISPEEVKKNLKNSLSSEEGQPQT